MVNQLKPNISGVCHGRSSILVAFPTLKEKHTTTNILVAENMTEVFMKLSFKGVLVANRFRLKIEAILNRPKKHLFSPR